MPGPDRRYTSSWSRQLVRGGRVAEPLPVRWRAGNEFRGRLTDFYQVVT